MKQGGSIKMRWPSSEKSKQGSSARVPVEEVTARELGFDEALFEKLKRLRNALAQSEGVPAYRIFNNQTLEFITRLKPTSIEAGLKIRGVGEAKARDYLPDFISAVMQHGKGKH